MSSPYNDKYSTYWDCNCSNSFQSGNSNSNNLEYDYPYSFEEGNQAYLQMKQKPFYSWIAGETVLLNFDIETILAACGQEFDVSVDELDFSQYVLDINFFNFRKELILKYNAAFDNRVSVMITKEVSDNYFPSGIYYCSVRLHSKDLESPCAISTVLLSQDDGLIYVR